MRKMAAWLDISIGSLSSYENGKSAMKIKTAEKISAKTKIPAIKFLNLGKERNV